MRQRRGRAETRRGDQDALRLHDALKKAGVPNQLITIPGGGHGNFTPEQRAMIYTTIREFLAKHKLM
jgi:dipeptidyl aminopeptidase/acylaminoacyl peptidase